MSVLEEMKTYDLVAKSVTGHTWTKYTREWFTALWPCRSMLRCVHTSAMHVDSSLWMILSFNIADSIKQKQTNSVTWFRERTIPTEQPPLVGEVGANFYDRGCHVVSVTDSCGRILGFLDRSHYFFFQVAPQLHSRGWVSVPDPLLLKNASLTLSM
jgi:hypothetical protein